MKAVRELTEFDVDHSEVARHTANSGHCIDFCRIRVLDRENVWRKRVIKEAWWTKKLASNNKVKFSRGDFWIS